MFICCTLGVKNNNNGFFTYVGTLKLTVNGRRASFGESALTLSVVVISIFFSDLDDKLGTFYSV